MGLELGLELGLGLGLTLTRHAVCAHHGFAQADHLRVAHPQRAWLGLGLG